MRRMLLFGRCAAPVTMFLSWALFFAALVTIATNSQVHAEEKGGRCPEAKMDKRICGDQVDQCKNDTECAGDSKCCSTGCSRVCILPMYTACEQARVFTEKRARSLEPEDARDVKIPDCDPVTGRFRDIQEDAVGFYCVDLQGFERPGTRSLTLENVNCTNPRPCDGPMCRMLCPHGFALNKDGCEVCECKNVCKDVKCPHSTECHVEEIPCTTEPCPPIATCKQPRTLESMCQFGAPLMIPQSGKPFLCGRKEPSCPSNFQCSINNDADYGVCCASSQNFEKSGTCPISVASVGSKEEGDNGECLKSKSCRHDLDCLGLEKCCISNCGKQCVEPANSTICMQQKHIAELLSQKEIEGKGYIPQCDENGNFRPRQCSRNGIICWCVTPEGRSSGPIGPANTIDCSNIQRQRAVSSRADTCDNVICSSTCQFGYKTDRQGCSTCDCFENPCDSFSCPKNSECKLVDEENCDRRRSSCAKPICVSDSLFVNPCALGTPLTEISSGKVVTCSESATTCPGTHICVVVSANQATGVCCANRHKHIDSYTLTKPGMCPFLESPPEICKNAKNCQQDSDCEHNMKCCMSFPGNCTVCADPLLQEDLAQSRQPPSMCEYLRDAKQKVGGPLINFKLAHTAPKCKDDGSFEELICNESHCVCVDEFGGEIANTKVDRKITNLTTEACMEKRNKKDCLGSLMTCRLGCDYGYDTDSHGCVICECRNPCASANLCTEEEQCELVDVDCEDGYCLPLPYCIPKILKKEIVESSCPQGTMFMTDTNETLTCNPRARMLQCPDDYFCHDLDSADSVGVCCPILPDDADAEQTSVAVAQNRHSTNKHENILNEDDEEEEEHFSQSLACQQQQNIIEIKARESSVPAKRFFIPQCEQDGTFSSVQCDPLAQFCYCVDSYYGKETDGTRVPTGGPLPNCHRPVKCEKKECSANCQFGYKKDIYGCPTCECKLTPCVSECERGQECRLVDDLPMCLPKVDNMCATGYPLTYADNGERVSCSPDKACPSSHYCNLSLYGEPGMCCKKPKEICFEKIETAFCRAESEAHMRAIDKQFFFNSTANECHELPLTEPACVPDTPNLFDSRSDCLSVCPALTHCEKTREKNVEMVTKYKHLTYIPKCDVETGDWISIQGFDEIGMYFCVNKKGEMIKGSLTSNGQMPNCQSRRGRLIQTNAVDDPPICEGAIMHKCNFNMCENRTCLAYPKARCIVEPCGGCKLRWILDEKEVNCEDGLSKCQKETQRVINSPTWINHIISTTTKEDPVGSSASNLGNHIGDVILQEESEERENEDGVAKTHIAPIYADINGQRVQVGVAASTSITFGLNSADKRRQGHSSIADILADMMRQGSDHVDQMSDFIDLMPSSSQIYTSEEMPPYPPPSKYEFTYPEASLIPQARIRRAAVKDSSEESMEKFNSPGSDFLFSILRSVVKAGQCAMPSPPALLRLLSGACSSTCRTDVDCPGDLKCCLEPCGGFKCVNPIVDFLTTSHPQHVNLASYPTEVEDYNTPLTMIPSPPQCMENGDYAPVQVQGDMPLSYCVDVDGNPHLHSFTKGMVLCTNHSGIIEERQGEGIVCPAGREPTVCSNNNNKCLHASCPLHPDVLCAMNVCDECQPAFYNESGEKVNCEEECIDGECEKRLDICKLPPRSGVCRASIERYYFDSNTNTCEQFVYGGCGGNGNNFITKEQCENRCPDIVLCPKINDGQLKACSRASVCHNTTCGAMDTFPDEYICSVEPCSCTAIFKDLQGKVITCETKATANIKTTTSIPAIASSALPTEVTSEAPTVESSDKDNEKSESFSNDVQILKVNTDSGLESRCISMKNDGAHHDVSCDELGRFSPLQCTWESKSPICWCVDEAGNQVEGTKTFVQGTRSCKRVLIEKVDISINFPVSDEVSSVQMGVEFQDLMKSLDAQLVDNKIEVEVLPASTSLHFALKKAENTVDVAYWLEQLVKKNSIGVVEDKDFVPADLTTSRFHYIVSPPSKLQSSFESDNEIFHDDAVSAEILGVDKEYNTVVVLLTIVAAITAVLTLLGLFFAFQKKKTTGSYPKKPFDSLAFNSQLYEYEKKMPIEKCPTFKATLPYVQEEYKAEKEKA